jgi:RHS repeat-associated protein
VLRDTDADLSTASGSYGKTSSGLEVRQYVLQDANWNVTGIVNSSGNVIERYKYDPYGAVTVLNGASDHDSEVSDWSADADNTSDWKWVYYFQGLWWDGDAKLLRADFRDLNVNLGRWMQGDRGIYVDAMSLYQYERSAPTNFVDPTGMVPGGVHHWYPLYLGGPIVQAGMRFLDAGLHTAVHKVFTDAGLGGPGCRAAVQVLARNTWSAWTGAQQKDVIVNSMRVAGLTEQEIAGLLPGILNGATPGKVTPRILGGAAFGAATIILTNPSVAQAAMIDPFADLRDGLRRNDDRDGDGIPDPLDPDPNVRTDAPTWVVLVLEVRFAKQLNGTKHPISVWRDTWFGLSGEWVPGGEAVDWGKGLEYAEEFKAYVKLAEQLKHAFDSLTE